MWALLTVVGSRGASRVTQVVLGSVALAIASSNPAPLAVIHPGPRPAGRGPVVVGSPTSEAALAFAFGAAASRRADFVAVHSWLGSMPPSQPTT